MTALPEGVPAGCPADRVLRMLWGDWTTHILLVLGRNGPTRFGELKRLVEGISAKVLTERLRRLEADRLIFRQQEATVPPSVTYGLTDRGGRLDEALRALERVAAEIVDEPIGSDGAAGSA